MPIPPSSGPARHSRAAGLLALGLAFALAGGPLTHAAQGAQSSQGFAAARKPVLRRDPFLIGLGDLPGGAFQSIARAISPDGSVVVGVSRAARGDEAFLWTAAGGMVGLGDLTGGAFSSEAKGVAAYGRAVVGLGEGFNGTEAFRWTPAGGMVGLGDLPGGIAFSVGTDLDATGDLLVGYGVSASGQEAWSWTAGTGLVGLGDLLGGTFSSRALRVSADGTTIVGDSDGLFGALATRWVSGGAPQSLYKNGSLVQPTSATSVSMDGKTIGGLALNGMVPNAFLWKGNVTTPLGVMPYQTLGTLGISHDGRRAGGAGYDGTGSAAWLWDIDLGVRDLRTAMMQEYGLKAAKSWSFDTITDLSGTGELVVGFGSNKSGNREAFLAFLPIRCRADLNHDGVLDLADVGLFSSAFLSGGALADFDGDGLVTPRDQTAYMLAFSQGCG